MTTETARIEAFSDGVFAIAITLLVLDIKIPAPDSHLARALLLQWPFYFSFIVSFAFIGIMWINHHRLFTHIKRSDNLLLILNLLLLLGVTSVPFPTAVLAANLGQPGQRAAAILFSATYFFIAIAFNALWRYATSRNHHLLAANADFAAADQISRQYAVGPLLYLICLGLAWVSVEASLALNAALACFFAFPPDFVSSRRRSM
ncbi:MAG TPA: TMEM175 family protein [Candidatus Acidoferrales bacterium]|nr:TMEM175 family protein [Candidatus Acidoferrales bacterium]